ncbi:DUF4129 domain-containing protein [Calothrix sp. PCC 7507]|uniref:DUF4129 domain-containing protein n=1 Tax=Calothrix sp. PCC 7507 TaxID=99598 RepID=UPI00029F0442|nr:DUF4129 domain-containing protein [Calothrix sp. PCC 7507]AFY34529.1 hypothetical protein Cal7507_4149 [Calothrix sp. PCC 7507]
MTTEAFEKTSWDWQLSQFKQQAGEWIEYQFSQLQLALPELPSEWSISPWLGQLLNILFWVSVGLFLAWVVWRLWREFGSYVYAWLTENLDNIASGTKIPSNDASIALLLTRSQEFYREGNYREACRCLYLAILQRLHDTSILTHKPSRTDGEYLQLLRSSITPVQPYETLITTHEQLCFGDAEILPENYEQCQQAYREIFNQ